jgi:hypothetical protein
VGLFFFAHRARFSFRDCWFGFCALLEDCLAVRFAFLPAEDKFFFFNVNHFGSGLVDACLVEVLGVFGVLG